MLSDVTDNLSVGDVSAVVGRDFGVLDGFEGVGTHDALFFWVRFVGANTLVELAKLVCI